MVGIAAPVIVAEMNQWVALGGGNSGIVGDAAHSFGFHVAADELPASDYSRTRDPNGSDGPYVNWRYACSGDFSHRNDETLRALQRNVLARLMNGELQMICEFIGKPWADQPVYYWARWNGDKTLQRYTGAGHDHWAHISWYRSRVDQPANLWTTGGEPMAPDSPVLNVVLDGTTARYTWNTPDGHGKPPDSVIFRLSTIPFPLPPAASNGNINTGQWPQPWGTAFNYPNVVPGQTLYAQVLARNTDGWSQPGSAVLVAPLADSGGSCPTLDEIRQVIRDEFAKQPKPLTAAETEQAAFQGAQRAEGQ